MDANSEEDNRWFAARNLFLDIRGDSWATTAFDVALSRIISVLCSILVAASGALVVRAADASLRPWEGYRTVMWVGNSASKKPEKLPLFFQRLREMGINAVTLHGAADARPLLENNFPFYVENIVNRGLCLKFSSDVREWDKFIAGWMANGRPESALARQFGFDDPEWRGWARRQMQSVVRQQHGHAPFAYDIRDELSTTISANPFDFDFGPTALAGFRTWLKTKYRDLEHLNTEWETRFATWEAVKPFTTDQIKKRMATGEAMPVGQPDWRAVQRVKFDSATAVAESTRWNFAPWADFRTYMDISLATTLADLRQAAREVDPRTPVGIEGTQMPSAFGGYDLWRLAQVLDWVEPYDIGNAREIFGSFMPGKPIVTTVFEKETAAAQRRLWHLLLEGDRGCVVWWSEDCIDWKSEDYALTAKARALAPVLRELQSPLAELFLRAKPEHDPIYLIYSQPSPQVDWLLESAADGATWPRRFSSFEARTNRLAQRRAAWMKLFQDLGYTPQFIASENLSSLAESSNGRAVLVLSDALALASSEAEAAMNFLGAGSNSNGRVILQDAPAGIFDKHGRLQSRPGPLAKHPASETIAATRRATSDAVHDNVTMDRVARDIAAFGQARVKGEASDWYHWAQQQFSLRRTVSVPAETQTRIHRFAVGEARLVAFERNIVYHMSEDLKQAGGNEALEKPIDLVAQLDVPAHVYDLRTQRYLGRTDQFSFTLDPWQPSLFALLPERASTSDVVEELRRKL